MDPELQWAGKTEGVNFEVDTVSLHVHERIDPLTIIEAVRKRELENQKSLFHYFENPENNLPIREAIEFYKHSEGWSNRLIAGDSLLVMNSLLEKEGMSGKIQMIYIDPPYGVKYGSNFQPFINKRDVKDGRDEDLTQEPEMVKAFRDTWELGIHSYLTYLRNRLLLAKELLNERGSCFIQISDENVHHVKEILDEAFGSKNFVSIIPFRKTVGATTKLLPIVNDYILWYAKEKTQLKFRKLYREKDIFERDRKFTWYETNNGELINIAEVKKEKLDESRIVALDDLTSQDPTTTGNYKVEFNKKIFYPPANRHWRTTQQGIEKLIEKGRLYVAGSRLLFKRYLSDQLVSEETNFWFDTVNSFESKSYVVQTNQLVIQRCLLMTTDPGDIVLDPTCGSGTTAYVAEQWGRRWITCDTSRVAIALAKQRLMTALFDYYELAHPSEGISSGFEYQTVPHITLSALANDEVPQKDILYDKPAINTNKKRVSGPFTVEAVPSQQVRSIDPTNIDSISQADNTIARSGETIRLHDWISEIGKAGIRGSGGQSIQFIRVEPTTGTKWIHSKAETKDGQQVAISFGPDYAPLEQRQVELAIDEAQTLIPKPKLVVFASFQFDPEAAKDIDQLKWQGVKVIKCQMNTDLLTSDLKKNKSSNESFWLIDQPY